VINATFTDEDGTYDANPIALTIRPLNSPPEAADDAYDVDEDDSLPITSPGVLGNDTDVDGDSLTAVLVPGGGVSHGTLTLNPDGSFDYTPDADYYGTDSFTYVASDGALLSGDATVTITVNPVNDVPLAVDDTAIADEDVAVTIDVLGNDSDIDGDTLMPSVVSGPSSGTVTLNPDGTVTYTPDPDFHGVDSFTYVANDGTADSAEATVTITVDPVNDAPVGEDDAYSLQEDATLNVAAPGVLGNDSDVDGDTLTAALVSGANHAALTLNPDGSFTYTPEPDFNGDDAFVYEVSDGSGAENTATVTITVNPVNDAPAAVDDAAATDEDVPVTLDVLANDADIDGRF